MACSNYKITEFNQKLNETDKKLRYSSKKVKVFANPLGLLAEYRSITNFMSLSHDLLVVKNFV